MTGIRERGEVFCGPQRGVLFITVTLLPVELRKTVLGIQPGERVKRIVERKGNIEVMQARYIRNIVC